jgi:hypothetical protein
MLLAGSESAERDLINREVGGCNLQPDSLGGKADATLATIGQICPRFKNVSVIITVLLLLPG